MQTFRKLDIKSYPRKIMFDEVNISAHLNLTDLANLISDREAKVKYNYYDIDIEKKKLELFWNAYDVGDTFNFNNTAVVDSVYIKIIKYKIKYEIMNKINFASQLQSILWRIRNVCGEKFCMYIFKKYNKIMGIDISADVLILDHPIDTILSSCFRSLVIVNKFLLQRDLSYDEYIALIAHKITTNIDNICEADMTIFENLLLNNLNNIDDCAVRITDKIIVHYHNSALYIGRSIILRIINTESFYNVAITHGNTDVIENIIKFATDMCCHYTIAIYSRVCMCDFNNIGIEKYFRYTDSLRYYDFFDQLCDNNIYEIALDKICESHINSFPVFVYFLKKYYRVSDINDINHDDFDLLPVDVICDLIINSIDNVDQQSIISISSNMQFIKHIIPDIFSTNSLALSHYYYQLCRLIDEQYTVLTLIHDDASITTCPSDDQNTKKMYFCTSIKKEIDPDAKKCVDDIKEEIDGNIKSGLLDYNKIISDIIRDKHSNVNDDLDPVLKSIENILGKQYLSIDNFDSLFMKVMNKIYTTRTPQKYRVEYFCNIINNLFPPAYCETDLYKNHYYSYLLNFAIDYIAIDGDYIILPGTNINLHITDFKFYPFFALLHTKNSHIIAYVIDNYNLSDLSVVILASFAASESFGDVGANENFLIVKLTKRYLNALKSRAHNCTDKDYSIAGIDFGYIENINEIIIE
jgi:hypothetical protein